MERYNKLRMIGKGTFGSAWLVESKFSGFKYAIKELSVRTMSVADRHLALNEVKILSTLKHKNIIRYKNAFEESCNFYIVMEYAEGGDLYSKIKQAEGFFLQDQVLDWFTQLLLALKHIHGLNILHRDLKTQNIFLTKSDVIKLGDFGIARILDSTTDHAQTTVGTPYYLSPEICQRQPYNQKSDMWALGCVMYEITTLKHPFTADCFSSLVVKILHGKYAPIPSEYGPLVEDVIAVLLRSNPKDRPSAKQLLYVPSMKKYVEKYAVVVPREKNNNTAIEPNAENIMHKGEENKWHIEKTENLLPKKLEPVKSKEMEMQKERNEHVYSHKPAPRERYDEDHSDVKASSGKVMKKRAKAYCITDISCRERASGPPTVATHQRRAESVSGVGNCNDKPIVRFEAIQPDVLPNDSSVASRIRMSILKEHQRRRHCSADSGVRLLDVEKMSNQEKPKRICKIRCERIYSDTTTSKKTIKEERKNTMILSVSRDTKLQVKPQIIKQEGNSTEKSLTNDEASLGKGNPSRVQRWSCSTHTQKKSDRNKKLIPVEQKNKTCLIVAEEDDSSVTIISDSDDDDVMVNVSTQPLCPNVSKMKQSDKKDNSSAKSRDRSTSSPCAREARARRRTARQSLSYHMHHCRRIQARSSKSLSCETIYKENLHPGLRQETTVKVLPKDKAIVASQEKYFVDAMVEPSAEFKRCQTYKVAQFRRLPLMSVPNVPSNVDPEPASDTNSNRPLCNGRRRSDSNFANRPKLSLTKFHGLKAAHIDRARRRAKRMSAAAEVGSSRREFSVNPDSTCAVSNKSLLQEISTELKGNIPNTTEEKDTNTIKLKENKLLDASDDRKIKFKFRGQTLHLNTTDTKSAFAHMEALRVFLEENLGTKRFIDVYQYLNDSVFLSEKEKERDCNVQHIIGVDNLEYLPLLHQLIESETNHFGTRV